MLSKSKQLIGACGKEMHNARRNLSKFLDKSLFLTAVANPDFPSACCTSLTTETLEHLWLFRGGRFPRDSCLVAVSCFPDNLALYANNHMGVLLGARILLPLQKMASCLIRASTFQHFAVANMLRAIAYRKQEAARWRGKQPGEQCFDYCSQLAAKNIDRLPNGGLLSRLQTALRPDPGSNKLAPISAASPVSSEIKPTRRPYEV